MKWKNNENGVTLIEVLATLTILSLLVGIVFGVFINGINYSNKAKDTVSIQQEANYLLTLLKEQHENQDWYTIEVTNDHKRIQVTNSDNDSIIVEQEGLIYFISDCGSSTCQEQFKYKVYPINYKKVDDIEESLENTLMVKGNFNFILRLERVNNPNINFQVKTILSRL